MWTTGFLAALCRDDRERLRLLFDLRDLLDLPDFLELDFFEPDFLELDFLELDFFEPEDFFLLVLARAAEP
ncbi:MAG: hypothetical protein KC777_20665 [Cyanobacteria bacterium HKST-UBA02]|nr:hypothetical protein [Cyanobacteria bacterium HKST-UBA02]